MRIVLWVLTLATSAPAVGAPSLAGAWALAEVSCARHGRPDSSHHALKMLIGSAVIDDTHVTLTYELKTYLDGAYAIAARRQMVDAINALEARPDDPGVRDRIVDLTAALRRFDEHRSSVMCATRDTFPYRRRGDAFDIAPSTGRFSSCPGEVGPDRGGGVANLASNGDVLLITSPELDTSGTCRPDEVATLVFGRTSR